MSRPPALNRVDSAELARCLFEESNDALLIFEPSNLQIIDANPRAQKLLRMSRKQLLQAELPALFDADTPDMLRDLIASCQQTRLFHSREAYQLMRGGSEPLEVNVTVSRLHTKPSLLGVVAIRDVSRRRALEVELRQAQASLAAALKDRTAQLESTTEALQDNERWMRELVDDVDAIVWEAELPSWQFTYVSQHAEEVLGFPVRQWLDEPDFWVNHLHEEDRQRCIDFCVESTARGEDHEFEYRAITADGGIKWLHDIVHVVQDASGSPTHLRGVMLDVSARVAADEETRQHDQTLSHVSRLSTLGEMVAGIAHEINQPLFSIRNFSSASLQALRQGADEITAAIEYMTEIEKQSIRASEIMKRLADFVRDKTPRRTSTNINQLAADAIELVAVEADRRHVVVHRKFEQPGCHIQVDPIQLQQVLINLLRNAYDALETNAEDDRRVIVRTSVEGGTVELEVSDNGVGFTDETAAKMFETFFSTKELGMGMGLAISRSIIKEHGGTLQATRNHDGGATFLITLFAETEQRNGVGTDCFHRG